MHIKVLKMQMLSKKTLNTIMETLPYFIKNKNMTVSQLAKEIDKDYTTALRRIKNLKKQNCVTNFSKPNNYYPGPSEDEYNITLFGIQAYFVNVMNKVSDETRRDIITLVAEKHPDKSLVFKYLDFFKENGYDLRDNIGAVIYSETMYAKHIYSLSPDAYQSVEDQYFFQGDVLTEKVLFFNSILSTPSEIEKLLKEKNEKYGTNDNLDDLLSLWQVCDKITELARIRRQFKDEIEGRAKRALNTLKRWEDLKAF